MPLQAAEDVATADDDADFDAHAAGFSDIASNPIGHCDIDPESLTAHEGFTGSLEEDAFEQWLG